MISPVDLLGVTRQGLAGLGVLPADGQHSGLVVEVDVHLIVTHTGGIGVNLKALVSLLDVLRI